MTSNNAVPTSTTFFIWRLCAWAGPLYMVVGVFSWAFVAGFLPAPPQYLNAVEIKDFYLANNLSIRGGMAGYIFIAAFYYVWSTVISRVMQRIEGPNGILAQFEFIGGISTAWVTLLSGVFWIVASFRTELRTPEEVQLLNDVGWFIFNMTYMVTTLQMVSFGLCLLLDPRAEPLMPKWLAWVSFAAGGVFLPISLMPFFLHGPFTWHGLITYWVGLGGFFIWITLASYYLFGAITKVRREVEREMRAA